MSLYMRIYPAIITIKMITGRLWESVWRNSGTISRHSNDNIYCQNRILLGIWRGWTQRPMDPKRHHLIRNGIWKIQGLLYFIPATFPSGKKEARINAGVDSRKKTFKDIRMKCNLEAFGWILLLIVLIILFTGEPDLHDALIKWLMECK